MRNEDKNLMRETGLISQVPLNEVMRESRHSTVVGSGFSIVIVKINDTSLTVVGYLEDLSGIRQLLSNPFFSRDNYICYMVNTRAAQHVFEKTYRDRQGYLVKVSMTLQFRIIDPKAVVVLDDPIEMLLEQLDGIIKKNVLSLDFFEFLQYQYAGLDKLVQPELSSYMRSIGIELLRVRATATRSDTQYRQIVNIFISSPNDVPSEREVIKQAIEILNRREHIRKFYHLEALAYEEIVPPIAGLPAQLAVDKYMIEPNECYLFICILWSRMGTPFVHPMSNKRYNSGTEYEFLNAYESRISSGFPQILLYKKVGINVDSEPHQVKLVEEFFKKFQGTEAEFQGLYKTFTTAIELKGIVEEHIDNILNKYPPPVLGKAVEFSDIIEEPRRLDAAMPSQVIGNQETEVWVQICLPESKGFRDQLPVLTEEGDIISQDDVNTSNLAVVFEVDESGKPKPIELIIDLESSDFEIITGSEKIRLIYKNDSGLMTFTVKPKVARSKKSIIRVAVRSESKDGSALTLGTVSLRTQIRSSPLATTGRAFSKAAWIVLSIPLMATTGHNTEADVSRRTHKENAVSYEHLSQMRRVQEIDGKRERLLLESELEQSRLQQERELLERDITARKFEIEYHLERLKQLGITPEKFPEFVNLVMSNPESGWTILREVSLKLLVEQVESAERVLLAYLEANLRMISGGDLGERGLKVLVDSIIQTLYPVASQQGSDHSAKLLHLDEQENDIQD